MQGRTLKITKYSRNETIRRHSQLKKKMLVELAGEPYNNKTDAAITLNEAFSIGYSKIK